MNTLHPTVRQSEESEYSQAFEQVYEPDTQVHDAPWPAETGISSQRDYSYAEDAISDELFDVEEQPFAAPAIEDLPSSSIDFDESVRRSQSARLSFVNLPMVNGSDGRGHVFALATGNPHNGELRFHLRIENRNNHYNFKNTRLFLRLTKMRHGRVWHKVNLNGQQDDAQYLILNSEEIIDESAITKTISINRNILSHSYDSDYPLMRLQVEFHWKEGFTRKRHMNSNSITFHLVQATELMLSRASSVGQIDTARDTVENRKYQMPLYEKLFTRTDRSPVAVNHSITTLTSESASNTISYSTKVSETRGQSTTVSAQHEQSSSGELGFGFGDIAKLGISSESTTTVGVSHTVSHEVTQEIARSMSSNRTMTSALNKTSSASTTIEPAPAGRRRILLAYPVFNKLRSEVIRFTAPNIDGFATRRTSLANVPLLQFSNWGYRTVVRRSTRPPSEFYDNTAPVLFESSSTVNTDPSTSSSEYVHSPDMEAGANRKLTASEVRYLVLEGGGGKGLAYLGAVRALESIRRQSGSPILSYRNNRLQGIQGIAGSSAGAITALGLSMGMNAQQLAAISDPQQQNFQVFFDRPTQPRRIPQLHRACGSSTVPGVLERYVFGPIERVLAQALDAIPFISSSRGASTARTAMQTVKTRFHAMAIGSLTTNGSIASKLLSPALIYYADNMWTDFGLFSGCNARVFLGRLLQSRGGTPNMTFREHYNMFRVKLVVTGSNMETGATNIFSADHTPQMPVADAVRISMGLPVLLKPVRISASNARRIVSGARVRSASSTSYEGLYVDGGLWNNLPMPVFAVDERNTPGTLGLALGQDSLTRTPITDLGDYLGALLKRFSGDDALANSYPSYRQQIITLDAGSIGTADFSPNRQELLRVQANAQRTVSSYFQ